MDPLFMTIGLIIGLSVGIVLGYLINKVRTSRVQEKNKTKAEDIIERANTVASEVIDKATSERKTIIADAHNEARIKRQELSGLESKLEQRESILNKRDDVLLGKESALDYRFKDVEKRHEELEKKEKALTVKQSNFDEEIASVAKMTIDEAKTLLLSNVEEKMKSKLGLVIKQREEEIEERSKELSQNILVLAMEKYAHDVTSERTISTVSLPNDELKGRIIGREGRNIKTIEMLTGVELIIDDTPEVISVSCFDPIRREIARRTLEYLIKDGRIQPGRIEDIVKKASDEMQEVIKKTGEETIFELGISRMSKELVELIGKLKFRTSYGQNGLLHVKETAYFASVIATELGLDPNIARRAGLLHDIGKTVIDDERSHAVIGADLAKKHGESNIIVNAIGAHHENTGITANSPYAWIIMASDALSASRPGARNQTLEDYIKRIEKLEEIAKSFDGVKESYAIQAGREIRILVSPDKIDDSSIYKIAEDIKEKIEKELTYPGQIKVTVIRELRVQSVAK